MKTHAAINQSENEILAYDRGYIWHPYASTINPQPVLPVIKTAGTRITLADGRELVDGVSSWWTAIHGYNHPVLLEAARAQLEIMPHVMFGGMTHQPAVDLASLLIDISPDPLRKVFFCDSGSVAVEVAIKMAIQFHHARGAMGKNKLLTVRSGYHGDTFHAMSVCDPEEGMHSIFRGILPQQYFADAPRCAFNDPWEERDIESFASLIREHHGAIAAAILEPIVQAAGGMRFYSPDYLRRVRELCDEHDVLLILDEIATGFGRTGKLFACHHAGINPDIMCLGKALTGGVMSLAATLTTEKIADGISAGDPGLFMHGPTFMAHAMACAVATASTRLLLSMPWEKIIHNIEDGLRFGLQPCRGLPHVADVRALGDIGVVELDGPVDQAELTRRFVDRGVWVRSFGNVIYLVPPYIINKTDLARLTGAVCDVVKEGLI